MRTRTGVARAVAFTMAAAVATSCASSGSDAGRAAGPASIATESSTTAASTTTSAAPTTTVARRAAPGDRLVLDVPLARTAGVPPVTALVTVDAWLVQAGATGFTQTAAPLGRATWQPDGRVQLDTTVPLLVATRTTKFGTALVQPITRGDYAVEIGGVAVLPVTITRDATPPPPTTARPAPIDPAQRVLGDVDLAGVAFGTLATDAEARLVARFGPPTTVDDWRSACVGEERVLRWGTRLLTATMHRAAPGAPATFTSYVYGTRDPTASRTGPAATLGLATARDITLGTTIAELRGIASDDQVELHTDYEGFVADRWYAPGGSIVVVLDRDVLLPDARVAQLSSPASTALSVC